MKCLSAAATADPLDGAYPKDGKASLDRIEPDSEFPQAWDRRVPSGASRPELLRCFAQPLSRVPVVRPTSDAADE